jgi:lipoate-protein ligase A
MPDAMSLLELTLETAEANLALDEALLIEADEGRAGAVLRFWDFPRFAVVLGASRRLADDVRVDACRDDGVPIVRRSSGGGTVVIGPGALNVTVILPGSAAPGLSAVDRAQHYVLDRIAGALRAAEPAVAVEGSGDLTVARRKFAGSAQRRLKTWFLVHCTILHAFPLERIVRYLTVPVRQPAYRAGRTHEDFLMNLGLPRTILHGLIRSAWSPSSSLSPVADVPRDLLETLLSERFANRSWIERL